MEQNMETNINNKLPNISLGKLHPSIIALDLDDTLLKDNLTISDFTVNILQQAVAKGIFVVLCSGRPASAILPFVRRLDIAGQKTGRFVIAQTGASILDLHKRQEIFSCLTEGNILQQVFHQARNMKLSAEVYCDSTIYVPYENSWTDRDKKLTNLNLEVISDYDTFLEKGFPKIVIPGAPEDIQQLQAVLETTVGDICDIVTSKSSLLEIQTKESSKGEALKWLCKHLGYRIDDLMVFGDSMNDKSMIETAPLSVAMINGNETIKKLAHYITEFSNDDDGVARFIERFVL